MSFPPQFELDVVDGKLAQGVPSTTLPLVVGVSDLGSPGLYLYNDPNDAIPELGHGPLTEQGLKLTGGYLALKTASSVAASNTAVTVARAGSSVGTVTLSGTANRDCDFKLRIKSSTDALGAGLFDYSADGGNEFSEEITIPSGGSYTFPKLGTIAATFNLQAGTPDFQANDVFSWTSKSAMWNTTDLNAALALLLASPLLIGRKIRKVCFTGIPALASTAATNFAAIASFMASLQARNHFARAMMDCGSLDTTSNVLTNFVAAVSDTRVLAAYGRCEMTVADSAPGFGLAYCSATRPLFVRAVGAELSENLGRVASGPLPGVKATTLTYDEEISGVFTEDNKITTLRTNSDRPGGAYCSNGFLKSPVGSDFQFWDWGCTLDIACEAILAGLASWTLAKLQALTDGSGFMDPRSAATVKKSIDPLLGTVMAGPTKDGQEKHVSGQQLTIATAYNFLQLKIIKATYSMIPLVPVEGGVITVGLASQLEA